MTKLFNTLCLFISLVCNGYTSESQEYSRLCNCINSTNQNIGILVENNQTEIKQNNSSQKLVRILSLDGGGTRGYAQAKFLELFCEDTGISNLGEYFDVVAGTSVGGINAVGLANGTTPRSMMDFFREKTPWVFTVRSACDIFSNNASYPSNKPNLLQMLYFGIFTSYPFYKSISKTSNYGDARLRRELTNIFGDRLLTSIKTKILLTAYNYSEYTPVLFTNTNTNIVPNTFGDVKIVDALMATTSAPIYFPSTQMKLSNNPKEPAYNIMDGGLFQNNPSSLAFTTAHMLYPSATKYCILSIGTGIRHVGLHISSDEQEPSNSPIIQYTNLWDIVMTNSEIDNDILFSAISNDKSNISYYRFNFKLDINRDYEMDTSTSEFFDYLDTEVIAKYQEDKDKIKQFINKLKDVD